jgi:hypothetical protein
MSVRKNTVIVAEVRREKAEVEVWSTGYYG